MNTKFSVVMNAALCSLFLLATPTVSQSLSWEQRVRSLVLANFTYPRSAELRGEQGQAIILVVLTADGSITSITLTKSSKSAILDREAIRIAQKIKRFPAPPPGTAKISIPISWKLN